MKATYVQPNLYPYGSIAGLTGKFGHSVAGDTEYTTDEEGNPIERGFTGSQDTCEYDQSGNPTNPNCPL